MLPLLLLFTAKRTVPPAEPLPAEEELVIEPKRPLPAPPPAPFLSGLGRGKGGGLSYPVRCGDANAGGGLGSSFALPFLLGEYASTVLRFASC